MLQNPQLIKFYKYNGLGNDFIIIDLCDKIWRPTSQWLCKQACRKSGIGFDQALFITNKTLTENAIPSFAYKIANANGSWVEQCGNGARCVGAWLMSQDQWQHGNNLYLKTTGRKLLVKKLAKNMYATEMGQIIKGTCNKNNQRNLTQLKTPYGTFNCLCFFIGNPHIVIHDNAPLTTKLINQIGSWCQQQSDLFPLGINVNFITKANKNSVYLRTYERGVGETQSCASGACCTAAAFCIWQKTEGTIDIIMQKGLLKIDYNQQTKQISQTGPAEYNFYGYIHK